MDHLSLVMAAVTHQIFDAMLGATGRQRPVVGTVDAVDPVGRTGRDRGAVSLEQVMWFVAAGVAVAIIATIIFQRIRDEANDSPINTITPPAGGTP